MNLCVNGIPRSGSTLVWQLTQGVVDNLNLPIKVFKIHPACQINENIDFNFITIRHPFDVAASRYRVRLSRDPNADGIIGFEAEIHEMLKHYNALHQLFKTSHTILRYEDFINNYDIIFYAIQKVTQEIPIKLKIQLTNEYSIKSNKERADKLKSFLDVDDKYIHGDHIGPVLPGSWKTLLPHQFQTFMIFHCSSIATEFGYEIN